MSQRGSGKDKAKESFTGTICLKKSLHEIGLRLLALYATRAFIVAVILVV